MHIYLVGGAVRDTLLNIPVYDRDWVVVGATPEQMLAQGYLWVGKDFPVFLHPKTKEEYALARTERKSGSGYTGFTVDASDKVTLEEDLMRRDLTINAIAQDKNGKCIDPYHGQADIKNKILRHVSSAFTEDPVRLLRVARFAARYNNLGFTIASETMALMQNIVKANEVDHLVAERVWKEMSRALAEKSPQIFFEVLKKTNALARLMPEIDNLFGVPQPEKHHPEIDTGVHTLLSLQKSAKLTDDTQVRFAALLHDLGKGLTPKKEWPKHIGHEKRSLGLIENICERFSVPNHFRDLALLVAEFHTHCHRALELNPKSLLKLFERLDLLRKPERLEKFTLACQADAQGRPGFENTPYPQAAFLLEAYQHYKNIDIQSLIKQGFKGEALGSEIKKGRLKNLKKFCQEKKDRI